jgi:hypothetical protein
LIGGLTAGAAGEPTIDIHAPLPTTIDSTRQLPRTNPAAGRESEDDEC